MITLTLTHKAVIYIPASAGDEYLDKVLAKLAADFGGATSQDVRGSYLSSDGQLIIESIHQVYAFTESVIDPTYFDDIVTYLRNAGEETIGLELDGTFYLLQ